MNSAFVREGGYGGATSVTNNDSFNANHIIVPDAQLLFTAQLHRAGADLVLIGQDGWRHIIPGYFVTERRPTLVAPNGASLSPDEVDLRAGFAKCGKYAQTQPTTPPDPIGKVGKVDGNATVIRNSVAVALNVGDAMFKNDVVETGIDGLVAIVFVDGTTFYLYANTRLVLDEFICNAEKSSNSALFRIVKGMFGFIAGKVATTGHLTIDTPLAQIQSTASAAGFGSLAFSIFTFGLIHELKAASADISLLENDTIDYKDLKHGVFEIVTKEARPRHIIVDDPGKMYVFQANSSGALIVQQVANTPIQMAQNESAYHVTHESFLRAQQDPFILHYQEQHAQAQPTNNPGNTGNPGNTPGTTGTTSTASTGSTGSSTPPQDLNIDNNNNNGIQLIHLEQNNDSTTATTITLAVDNGVVTGSGGVTATQQQLVLLPPPVVAATATITAQTLGVNQATTITGVSVSESGATAGEIFTVTLADNAGQLSATATGGGDTVSGSGTTSLTIVGTLSQVNSDLATLSDSDGTAGADMITLTVTNGFGNSSPPQTIAVVVNGLPVIAVPGAQTLGIGQATTITGVSVSESGTTTGETFTVTVSDSTGVLSASGGTQSNGGHTLTLSGLSLTTLNSDLATLSDTDSTAGSDSLVVNATDSFNNKASQQTIAVTATGAPVIAVPGAQTLGVNQAAAITGVSVSESGATAGETFTVTLSDSTGVLTASGGTQSNGGHTLTLSGLSLTTLNSDLATLSDSDGTAGADTITLNGSDSFGNSATQKTIAVVVNGLPVIAVPGAQTLGIGQATTITGVSVSESGTTTGETFTVTVSDSNGVLSASGGTQSNGGHTLTLSGLSLTTLNSDLATLSDTDSTAGSDSLVVNATDSFNNKASQQTIAVTATGAPVIAVPGAQTLGVNQAAAITGVSVSESGATAGETFTVTLSDSTGVLTASGGTQSNGGHTLTLSGLSLTTLNSDLATLSDSDGTAGADTITLNGSDSFGNSATQKTIAVVVNGLPVIAVPGAQTLGIGQATTITGVSVSESGTTTGETFTVTVSDSNGVLSASGGTQSNGGHTLTLSGLSLTTLNSDLATLSDTDSTAGSDSLVVNATDSFNNKASQQTIAVTATGAPVIAVPGAQTLGVNQAAAITGVSVSESGATAGETFTVTLSDSTGVLTASGGTQSNGGHTLTLSGLSLTTLNSDLATLSDSDGTAGADTITLNGSDSFGNSATQKTIAVVVNGLPVIAVPGAQTLGIGQATTITGVSVSESGTTTGETFTVTVSDSNGVLSASGGTQSNGGHTLTLSGLSLTTLNSDLATLSDTDSTAGSDSLVVNATDSFNNKASQQTIAVTATGAPVIAVPGAQTLGVNQAAAITGVSVSESGATAGETFTVTLSDSTGVLTASGGTQSNGGHTLTLSGLSLTTLNSDLATLSDSDGTAGADTITLNGSDSFGNSATQKTIAVVVNGLPVIAVPGAQTLGIGQATTITGVSVSESGTTTGETFTVTVSDSTGVLSASGGTQSNGGHTLTLSGLSLTTLNSDLATLSDTDSTAGSDSLVVNATDSFNNKASQQTIAVTATGAPVIAVPGAQTLGVNQAAAITGVSVSESGATAGETFTVTLSDSTGVLTASGGTQSNGGHTLTLSGLSLTTLNSDLATLSDSDGTAGADTITLNGSDSFGNSATQKTIAVVVNGLPVIAVPGAQTLGIGQATTITGVSVSESGTTTGETFTVTVSDSNGVLSASGGTQSNGGHTLTLSGLSLTTLNSDLATLSDTDSTAGSDSLVVNATDSFNNKASQQTIAVTAQNPNQDNWTSSSGGDWATASDWDNGLPISTSIADLDAGGSYTVISSGPVTINELLSTSTAKLNITGGTFTVADYAGQGPLILSAGTLDIGGSTAATASLTQSGGELNGTGTLTATGASSFFGRDAERFWEDDCAGRRDV